MKTLTFPVSGPCPLPMGEEEPKTKEKETHHIRVICVIYDMMIGVQMGQAHNKKNAWCVSHQMLGGYCPLFEKWLSVWRSEPAAITVTFPVL